MKLTNFSVYHSKQDILKGMKELFRNIGGILSYLFPYKLYVGYKKIKDLLFSGYVKNEFKLAGEGFSIRYPIYIKGGKYISIGDNFVAFPGFWIDAYDNYQGVNYQPNIQIGNNVSFNFNCHIGCINSITIGNNVLVASKVYITDHFHGDIVQSGVPPAKRKLFSKGPVTIEDNVWIGEAVVILPNVTIGKNSVIGANSVVTKSFSENSIIAGAPAKLIKTI